MNLKAFLQHLYKKLKKKDIIKENVNNTDKLTTAWFINTLPSEISKREDAENLLNTLLKLDSEFSEKDFIFYINFTPKVERELLSKKIIDLVNAYLAYELEMTEKMYNLINSKYISESTMKMLINYNNINTNNIKATIHLYRNLVNFICQ